MVSSRVQPGLSVRKGMSSTSTPARWKEAIQAGISSAISHSFQSVTELGSSARLSGASGL